jgi:hypothetical protein
MYVYIFFLMISSLHKIKNFVGIRTRINYIHNCDSAIRYNNVIIRSLIIIANDYMNEYE